ncbi:MAG: hypothetical protein KIT09_26640 [Bryobacteraceae bacterium]|nr:hypothetical protein [Bryobacteraceae bacterium]
MTPDQAKELLGGYATGTLTEAERKALFEAALSDQSLFDALAEEDALRLALEDRSYRIELASMLEPKRSPWWRRPANLAWAGSMAAVAVVGIVAYQAYQPLPHGPAEVWPDIVQSAPRLGQEQPEARDTREKQAARSAPLEIQQPILTDAARTPEKKKEAEAVAAAAPITRPAEVAIGAPPAVQTPEPSPAVRTETEAPLRPGAIAGAARQPQAPEAIVVPPSSMARETASAAGAPPVARSTAEPGVIGGYPAQADVAQSKTKPVDAPRMMAYREGDLAVPGEPALARRSAAAPAVLAWQALRRNPDGSHSDVKPADSLAMDDDVQLAVVCAADGHLYLIDQSGPEPPALLYSGLAQRGIRYVIPTEGPLPPPKNSGRRRLVLLFSPKPLPLDVLGVSGPLDPRAAAFSIEIPLNYRPNR